MEVEKRTRNTLSSIVANGFADCQNGHYKLTQMPENQKVNDGIDI